MKRFGRIVVLIVAGILVAVAYPIFSGLVTTLVQERLGRDVPLWAVVAPFIAISALVVAYFVIEQRGGEVKQSKSIGSQDSRSGAFMEGGSAGTIVGVNYGTITIYNPEAAALTLKQRRNRRAMLDKMHNIWIDGVLEQSLYNEVLIELGMQQRADAVASPISLVFQQARSTNLLLPAGTRIIDVYDTSDRALLILGEPGAGKTTLLLQLTRDLITRARYDDTHPVPVVFPLSSWAQTRRPLMDWLVAELHLRYGINRKVGETWISGEHVLPLLDGLDEVDIDAQPACVDAINAFRQDHGLLPLVVCCRVQAYESLTIAHERKLNLHAAIVVQPLQRQQVRDYLRKAHVSVRPRDDSPLWDLLQTPLLLDIATRTYTEIPAVEVSASRGSTTRDQIFEDYVDSVFQRGTKNEVATKAKTLRYLGWLALHMQRHNQTTFYLESLQPEWLPRKQQWIPTFGVATITGICVVAVVGIGLTPVTGLGIGLAVGIGAGFSRHLKPVDRFHWSWAKARLKWRLLLACGIAGGISIAPWAGIVYGALYGLLVCLGFGVVVMLILTIAAGLAPVEIEQKTIPYQGIRRSLHNALISLTCVVLLFGVLEGALGTLVGNLSFALSFGLVYGVGIGVGIGLTYGGRTYLQHHTLRRILVRNGSIPSDYVAFLDYAAQRILLRKVGGGYIFIHRLLLDWFAAQYERETFGPRTDK